MPRTDYKTTEQYIKTFPKDVQEILQKVRRIIIKSVSGATEGISYGIPTIYLNGKYLVYFAGFKNHISVYPATTEAVEKAGLSHHKVPKGTLRFSVDKPIPYNLIGKFVKERVKERRSNQSLTNKNY